MKHIDMKLGPLTKIVKRSERTSKKFDDDVMQNVIFPIFGQFGAVQKPDSGHRVCKPFVLQKLKTELKNL